MACCVPGCAKRTLCRLVSVCFSTSWHTHNKSSGRKALRYNRPRANHTTIAQLYIFKDYGLRTDPATVANLYGTNLHRQLFGRNSQHEAMIAVGYINIRTKHVVIADLDLTTRVDHHVAIEIV